MKIFKLLSITGFTLLLSACDFDFKKFMESFETSEHPELIQAVLKKDYVTMEYLLKKGADPDEHSRKRPMGHSAYSDRHTALTLAAAGGDNRAVKILMRYKADRHEPTKNGMPPIEWALAYKHVNTAKLLWEHEPHTEYVSHGTAVMIRALYARDFELYQYFRKTLKDDRYIKDAFARLLSNASGSNNREQANVSELVRYLIARGEKPGPEALLMAMYWYSPDILDTLLATGLDPNALIKIHDNNTVLMTFLSAPSGIDIAKALLQRGADINALNSKGQNALMYLVASKFTSKERMSHYSVKMVDGLPAPSNEFVNYHAPLIRFYVEHGARTDLVDKQGRDLFQQINSDDFDAPHKIKLLKELISAQNKLKQNEGV